jgi:hypothetical protein
VEELQAAASELFGMTKMVMISDRLLLFYTERPTVSLLSFVANPHLTDQPSLVWIFNKPVDRLVLLFPTIPYFLRDVGTRRRALVETYFPLLLDLLTFTFSVYSISV